MPETAQKFGPESLVGGAAGHRLSDRYAQDRALADHKDGAPDEVKTARLH